MASGKGNYREELAWAAGFVDGEGHFGFRTTGRSATKRHGGPVFTVGQVGRETLDRLRDALGFGAVRGPYDRGKNQPQHQFGVASFEKTQAAIAMLWTFLSTPKRNQARNALLAAAHERNQPRPPYERPSQEFCKRGHPLAETRRIYGKNRKSLGCNICRNLRRKELADERRAS